MTTRRQKIRKTTLVSLATILLATSVGAYGTFAYFTDTEESTSNLFQAGTLDLVLEHPSNVDAFIGSDNLAPGDVANGSLTLKNQGTINSDSHTVSLSMDTALTATDADGASTNMSRYLELTQLDYDGQSLLASISDANANGYIDLADLQATTLSGLADPGSAGKVLDMEVSFHTSAGNDLQGDSVNAAFSFTLAQS